MTMRLKGFRPPAGTPRQQICVFYWQGLQKLASGIKNPSKIRGSSRPSQGLQVGPVAALSCTLDMILQTSPAGDPRTADFKFSLRFTMQTGLHVQTPMVFFGSDPPPGGAHAPVSLTRIVDLAHRVNLTRMGQLGTQGQLHTQGQHH